MWGMEKKADKKRRSKTYHKWLLSYVLLMSLPLLFGCVIYGYAIERIEEDVEYVQRQTLTQVKNTMEGTLDMCKHIGLTLTNKTEAEGLKKFEGNGSYATRQRFYPKALVEDMLLYAASNETIEEIMLYFPKTDYVVKNARFCPLEYSKISEETDYKMTLEELRSLSIRGGDGLHALDNGKNGLLYVYSVYGQREEQADITVLIYLNTRAIRELVRLAQSSVFLSFADGSWFSSEGEELLAEWVQAAEEGDYALLSGAQEYLMKLRSPAYQMDFLNVIEKRLYLEGVNRMRLILAVYVLVGCIGGVGIAWYVSKRNYQPVKELLELTGRMASESEEGNDFLVIRTAYQKLLSAYRDKEARLRESRAGEKNGWMNELLKGRSSSLAAATKGFDTWVKEMQYETFVLLGVDLIDMGSMQEEEAEEISTEVMDMAYFIVQNILGELLEEHYQAVEAETDGKLFALVNVNDQFDHAKVIQDLKAISRRTYDFIKQNFGMKLMINISRAHEGRNHIRDCYKEIEELLEYRDFEGIAEETILARSDYQAESEENGQESRELRLDRLLRQIRYLLQQEDYKKVQNLIATLQQERIQKKAGALEPGQPEAGLVSQEIGRAEIDLETSENDLVSQETGRIETAPVRQKSARVEITLLRQETKRAGTAGTEQEAVREREAIRLPDPETGREKAGKEKTANGVLAEENQTEKESQKEPPKEPAAEGQALPEKEKKQIERLMDQIAAYIEAHYTDGLLSAGVLADEFNIGLSYMSRSFKKQKGIGILDYINRLRLNRAKELLAEGATVRETAEQVGYYTTQPLIRVFRQMEGMTPSEYRNSLPEAGKAEKTEEIEEKQ